MGAISQTHEQAHDDVTAGYAIVARAAFWLVGFGGVGPYASARRWVMPLWDEFVRRQDELPAGVDRSAYVSPCHGREAEFTFYIGFAARKEIVDLPAGMVCIQVPAHDYVVGRVQGPREQIERVYATLPAWAETQGREINKAILWLEIYRAHPGSDPRGPVDFDVCLPLR